MSYTAYLGKFNKKLNSTKRPASGFGTSYTVVLKDEMSYISPVLTLNASFSDFTNHDYNYAVFLGRYYWITDIIAVRTGLVEIHMDLDRLATYKNEILGTSAFIEYGFNSFDASAQTNGRVPDVRIPISKTPTLYRTVADPSGGLIDATDGCYIVQAVGNNPLPGGSHRGLAAFAMNASTLRSLVASAGSSIRSQITTIMSQAGTTPADEIANKLASFNMENALLQDSAFGAIESVNWLPFKLSSATGTNASIFLGNYHTNISALMLTANSVYTHTTTINILWPVDDWRRNNCQIVLYLPFFGTMPVPVDQCIDRGNLVITWTAEYFSGSVSVKVSAGNYVVYTGSTNLAVPFGVGRSMVGAMAYAQGSLQALGGTIQAASGIFDAGASIIGTFMGVGGGGLAGAMANITGGISNQLAGWGQTIQPTITCAGSMGGMAAIGQSMDAEVCVLYYAPVDESGFQTLYGHPVFKIDTPASGFCKTRGFSISLPNNGSNAAYINSVMDGGVFIE